ncbi:MAG: methyltransferase domain-containing protein [Betaproteobacteria bacterium]|nr:methyltransferase domain-containing protein [Betaproteobacteria bacterium]
MLAQWFESEQGKYVLDWELAQFDSAVDDVFGYHALQIGLPEIDFLRENRIPHKTVIGVDEGAVVRSRPWELPIATNSVDLVLLPHVLEFSEYAHQILREAERVLMPDGSIVISGFNPVSLWGAKHAFGFKSDRYPWRGKMIGLIRLRDWLKLLSFEQTGGRFGCYAPPFKSTKWLERWKFMEKAGERWWPIAGGAYVVRAIKRTVGMRLVMPSWRERRTSAKALAPVAQRGNAASRGGLAARNANEPRLER